ncbi:MAG: hypothetical protein KDD41_05485 [Flavobacteriales bacterium]|nr:hypothetical protein [Flavobacteriales bacterium]
MHNFRTDYFIGFLLLGVLFFSCSKEKFEATVPAYISIDKIDFTTNYATEGSASSNIPDAWVYLDDDLVGVYELPATFPVLKTGNRELKIYGGIKDNGIAASRARYLLYDPYVLQLDLQPEGVYKIEPTITYNPDVKFTWLEDFENASLSFLYHSFSDTVVFKQTSDVKEGSVSGGIYLESNMDFFEATSVAYTNLPQNGSVVYFEMDFKTNEPIWVGIYDDEDQYKKVKLNVKDDWTKIYINLTDLVNARTTSNEIKVFFGMASTTQAPFVSSNPTVYIDNLKLVHY